MQATTAPGRTRDLHRCQVLGATRIRRRLGHHLSDFTMATPAEPGNLFFDWSRSVDDPNVYVLVEAFRDGAAGEAHVTSAHSAAAMATFPAWVATTPEIVNVEVPSDGWSLMAEFQPTAARSLLSRDARRQREQEQVDDRADEGDRQEPSIGGVKAAQAQLQHPRALRPRRLVQAAVVTRRVRSTEPLVHVRLPKNTVTASP